LLDFDRAIQLNSNPEAYANRGYAKSRLGDKSGAIVDLNKAAELFRQKGRILDYEKVIKLLAQIK
jgi:Flp pilus assembly protein TadD